MVVFLMFFTFIKDRTQNTVNLIKSDITVMKSRKALLENRAVNNLELKDLEIEDDI